MKQEHRLVAEVYRWLAPFVDATRDVYLSPDGQAAKTAVAAGRFVDPDIPDLWFTLVGATSPTHVEAKVLEDNGRVLLMQSQIRAWRASGTGAYKPHYWVATNRRFDEFFCWPHATFEGLHSTTAAGATAQLSAPSDRARFHSVAELALHILRVTAPNTSLGAQP
jgi:hypothetical protein